MLLARQLSEVPHSKNSVVTVGFFDGVHRAHQEVIHEVVRRARERSGRSVIVTFDPHPKQVLGPHPESIRLLSTLEERVEICRTLGVDVVLVLSFSYEFSRQSFRDFYQTFIVNGIGVSEVIEGYDHHFGRDREGSIEALIHMGKEYDFSVIAMKPVMVENETVSSSAIRNHLLTGNVRRAADLLGRPYSVTGTVVRGDGRGRSLGYPTANIAPSHPSKLVPQDGIYVGSARWSTVAYYGLISIGTRPTFVTAGHRSLEISLLGFDGDLYGAMIEIQFLEHLRGQERFGSAEELIRQMDADKAAAMTFIQQHEKVLRQPLSGTGRR